MPFSTAVKMHAFEVPFKPRDWEEVLVRRRGEESRIVDKVLGCWVISVTLLFIKSLSKICQIGRQDNLDEFLSISIVSQRPSLMGTSG